MDPNDFDPKTFFKLHGNRFDTNIDIDICCLKSLYLISSLLIAVMVCCRVLPIVMFGHFPSDEIVNSLLADLSGRYFRS